METRANYALIGFFTLAVIAAGFGFVYWFHRGGGLGERATYHVVFDQPVSGLRTGAAVVFNGIRVGEVTELALSPDNPRQVIATISVSRNAPVRADTRVGVEYQGLTGIAALGMRGGQAGAPLTAAPDGRPPMLRADAGTSADVMQAGREVLRRLDEVLSENQEAFRKTIRNLEIFTETMARNTERIDRIMSGAENFITGADQMLNGKDGQPGEIREAVQSIQRLFDNLDTRTGETLASFKTLAENFDKRTDGAISSIKNLADNVDQRTAEIAVGLSRFTNQGLRKYEQLADDARRAVGEFERAVRNFDRNPSRILFGSSNTPSATPAEQTQSAPARRRR
jgi:phospholipid/cholesterol/gamma-HCH transport system substrate-binding protein